MKKAYKRSQRVADQVRRDVSEVITDMLQNRTDLMVTISSVQVTDDLRYAKIFYTVLGDEKKQEQVVKIFERSAGYIQAELAHRLRLRRMPEISLHYDKSLMEGLRITSMIDQMAAHPKPEDDQTD